MGIGKFNRLHPGLRVKMPWRLIIGDYCWIGEDTWIDNISLVTLQDNICVSQGVYFCTGNHDFKNINFNLICKPITIDSECWIGSKVIIGPGNIIGKGSVVKMGSIVTQKIPPNSLVSGTKTINNYFLK